MIHPFLAFGFSGPDLMVIAVLVLVLFGAKKLPLFARSLGRSMGEFRKAKEEFEKELNTAADDSYSTPPQRRIDPPAPQAGVDAPKAAAPAAEPHSHQA